MAEVLIQHPIRAMLVLVVKEEDEERPGGLLPHDVQRVALEEGLELSGEGAEGDATAVVTRSNDDSYLDGRSVWLRSRFMIDKIEKLAVLTTLVLC